MYLNYLTDLTCFGDHKCPKHVVYTVGRGIFTPYTNISNFLLIMTPRNLGSLLITAGHRSSFLIALDLALVDITRPALTLYAC
jgi:hypothetical protein